MVKKQHIISPEVVKETQTPKPPRAKRHRKSAPIRYERFAREYLIDLNGTRAAIAAGYSPKTAASQASDLLNVPKVQALIAKLNEKRQAKTEVNAEKVLTELALMGHSNMLDYIRVVDGDAVVDLSGLTREQAAAMQEITVEDYVDGRGEDARDVKRIKFKLADKARSLELLGKHLALFADRQEHSGPGGGPLKWEVTIRHIGETEKVPA